MGELDSSLEERCETGIEDFCQICSEVQPTDELQSKTKPVFARLLADIFLRSNLSSRAGIN